MSSEHAKAANFFLLGDFLAGLAAAGYTSLARPLPPRFAHRDVGYFALVVTIPLGLAALSNVPLLMGLLLPRPRAVRGGAWLPLLLGALHLPLVYLSLWPLSGWMPRAEFGLLSIIAWAAWPALLARWFLSSGSSAA